MGRSVGPAVLGLGLGLGLAGCGGRYEMGPPAGTAVTTSANTWNPNDPDGLRHLGAPPSRPPDQVGIASWYGQRLAGRRTANGERFDPSLFTAAHKRLPFGTWVEVRRIDNGRTVRVRINDRGPNGRARHRLIDLSRRAAEELDLVRDGVARVELRIIAGP